MSFAWQIVGEMHPGQHLIGMEVYAGFHVVRMVEERRVKVYFIRKSLCAKEHRRAAFAAEATGISRAADEAHRHIPKKLPAAILLPDPRGEGRRGCAPAALTVAVTDPIGTPRELKQTSAAKASPSDGLLRTVHYELRSISRSTSGNQISRHRRTF